MTLDVLFQSTDGRIIDPTFAVHELAAVDVSEAHLMPAANFLDSVFGDGDSRNGSRAQTPMMVSNHNLTRADPSKASPSKFWQVPWVPRAWPSRGQDLGQPNAPFQESIAKVNDAALYFTPNRKDQDSIRPVTGFARITRSVVKLKQSPVKEVSTNAVHYPALPASAGSKRNVPRPSMLPQNPSVDDVHIACDQILEYALVVSMYEVYNDRIFDLLTRTSLNSKMPAKDARRRPLLFKSTEYSPDRKVVAGLKKLVCRSLEEALMVLETGLLERRVAGTGSNATSSRSHGFFCIEVKKKSRGFNGGTWTGNSLTVVDLAGKTSPIAFMHTEKRVDTIFEGSERARNANTAGATLAEAGKINESLMYLGQCMQMQSDNSNFEAATYNQHTGDSVQTAQVMPANLTKPGLVPFRQCRLTELLFSNSFHHHSTQRNRNHPQKAIMIVTADPQGDFNATSQILRYSALAREVTVPRIPSVTSTILAQPVPSTTASNSSRPTTACSNYSTHSHPTTATLVDSDEENPRAASASVAAEIALLRYRLVEESQRRYDAETSWARAEQRLGAAEEAVRRECWDAFDKRMDAERERWKVAWEEERYAAERMIDEKLGLLMRRDEEDAGFEIHEDGLETRVEELERENELLREKVKTVTRQRDNDVGRTPSRKLKGLKGKKWVVDGGGLGDEDRENSDPYF